LNLVRLNFTPQFKNGGTVNFWLEEGVQWQSHPFNIFWVVIHVPPHVAIHPIHPHKILTCGKKEREEMKEKVWLW